MKLPITAFSLVNALGRSTTEVLTSLREGRSGLRPPSFDLPIETVVGEVPGPLDAIPKAYERYDCRLTRIAWMAYAEIRCALAAAVARWGEDRVAIVLGTSTGGLHATEETFFQFRTDGTVPAAFDFERQHSFNALAELLALDSGATGPQYTVSTACSSSGKSHAAAERLIRAGFADAVLVGGSDSLCRMTLQGFHGLGVLSKTACRPFGRARDGINIGEGVAFQLIEREGDADVALLAVGESSDAHHMSSPHPEGRGAIESMSRAVEAAGLSPDDVGYVNAHGTSTVLNDSAEAIAIRTLFGDRVPVSSTKGFTGHLLGAAAATEAVFAIHAVLTGELPQNLGCPPEDAEPGIDLVTAPRRAPVRHALSNSFAFGGSNVTLAIGGAR
jgi:3-oxoacyl-[acyl-carrier-protein] synthase-1